MKINDKLLGKIRKEAEKYFIGAKGCHDWSHVERVHDLAVHIGKKEKADLFILRAAAYLHDIGRKEEIENRGKMCHAEMGAKMAENILKTFDLDGDAIANIKHCIASHRFRNDIKPETLEAKILYDADKLDSIGAVGVGRDFLFAGHSGSNCLYTGNEKKMAKKGKDCSYTKDDSALLEYYVKLRKIKSKILTREGRRMAEKRHEFMVKFFIEFEREIKGNG